MVQLLTSTDFAWTNVYNLIHKEKAMEQNIYLDVYFGFNFLMDFFVLFITKIIIKSHKAFARVLAASSIGALYAAIILIFNLNHIFELICTYIIVAELMIFVAFGRMKRINNLKTLGIIYFVTFVLSGIINLLYYSSNDSLVERGNKYSFGVIRVDEVLPVLVGAVIFVTLFADVIKRNLNVSRKILNVEVIVGEDKINVLALPDTGNSLIEPMTRKPVSVIEKECLEKIDVKNLKYMVVPYNSVGKRGGIMEAFIADKMVIGKSEINSTIIGIYEGRLSQSGQYNMILHPDLIEKGECK